MTYRVMSNHFHLLVEVPGGAAGGEPGRDEVFRRLGFLYDRATVDLVGQELERAAALGDRPSRLRARAELSTRERVSRARVRA